MSGSDLTIRQPSPPQDAAFLDGGRPLGTTSSANADSLEARPHDASGEDLASIDQSLSEGHELVAGRFRIEERIGLGGMGSVYRAFDSERGTHVALKTLNAMEPTATARLKAEFRALADVTHPNLAALHELFADGERWFFTMELLEGHGLIEHLRGTLSAHRTTVEARPGRRETGRPNDLEDAADRRAKPLSLHALREAFQQLVDGVSAIHAAGKLHRDLKPSNVMIDPGGRVVVLDFGLVIPQPADGAPMSKRRVVVGTPAYMAPEQAAGEPAEPASDWYAVGCMLYEALTGRLPFEGPRDRILHDKRTGLPAPIRAQAQGLPLELCELCMALLSPDPHARPSPQRIRALLGGALPRLSGVPKAPSLRISEAPLVGRGDELQRLRAACAQAAAGQTSAVLVHGAPGTGKSRLIHDFLDEIRASGDALVFEARCYEREAVPYKAFETLVDALVSHLQSLRETERERVLPKYLHPLSRVVPAFSVFCPASRGGPIPDPHELRFRAFLALKELLYRLSRQKTVVVHVDDLQWGDEDGAELLFELLQPPDSPALLFVGSYRSGDGPRSAFLRHLDVLRGRAELDIDEIELLPLDLGQSEQLASWLLKSAPRQRDPQALVQEIARESAGSPLFLIELISYRNSHAPPPGIAMPAPTLSTLVEARLEDLGESEKRVLEVVALAARPVEQRLVLQAAGVQSSNPVLGLLRSERLVRTHGVRATDTVECSHDRIREILTSRIDPVRKLELHAALAEALERSDPSRAEMITEHYLAAGAPARAAPFAAAAADATAAALAFDRAARLYDLALRLCPGGASAQRALREKRGRALVNAGRGVDAAEAFLRASFGAPPGEALDLRRQAAEQLLKAGHYERGRTLLREVIVGVGLPYPETTAGLLLGIVRRSIAVRLKGFRSPHAAGRPEPEQARLLDTCWSAAFSLWILDPLRFAFYTLEFTLRSLKAGDPNAIAKARATYGLSLILDGPSRHGAAMAQVEQARALATSDRAIAYVKLTEAGIHHQAYRHRDALRTAEEAERLLTDRCTGMNFELSLARTYAFVALTALGEFRELRRHLERFDRDMAGYDHFSELQAATFDGVATLIEDGDMGAACTRMRAIMGKVPAQARKDYITATITVELYAGHPQVAWERIEELERDLGRRGGDFKIYSTRIEYLLRRGQCAVVLARGSRGPVRKRALAAAGESAQRLSSAGSQVASAYAALVRAGIADTRTDRRAALAALRQAAEIFEACEMPAYRALVHKRLGDLGDAECARSARIFFEHHGVANPTRLCGMYGLGW